MCETFGIAEQRAAGDEHVRSRGDGAADGLDADATVDFDVDSMAARIDQPRDFGDLRLHRRDVLLPAEARVHRHHEHVIDEIEHMRDG